MVNWIAIGPVPGGVAGYAMHGDTLVSQLAGADETAALAEIGDVSGALIVRIGQGPPQTLPAQILPDQPTNLAGFTQDNPPDVIDAWVRLQTIGFMRQNPQWDGIVCVPGVDVTHWLHISADELVSCASFLTPRLIGALGGSETPCVRALNDSISRPERLAAHLRAAEVSGLPDATTGHLIGAEIAAARPYWLGQQVALFGAGGLVSGYDAALRAQDAPTTTHNSKTLISNGLAAISLSLGMTQHTAHTRQK